MNTDPGQSATVIVNITVPAGSIITFGAADPPDGWLLCDGRELKAGEYPELQKLIGSKLPDLRSRFVVGAGAGANLSSYSQNQTGGEESVTLNVDEIPPHKHKIYGGDFGVHRRSFSGSGDPDRPFETQPDISLGGTDEAGGGKAHENRPPFWALTYIIKY